MPALRDQRGLTLLEVMIAVTITAILMATIYGVFSSNSRARARVEESSRQIHQARVFFDRLGRELRGANWEANRAGTNFICTIEDNKFKELTFTTSLETVVGMEAAAMTTVRYVLETEAEDRKILYRAVATGERAADGEDAKYLILSDVAELGFRFYGNGAWFEKWNAGDEKKLPRLVEVTLGIRTGNDIMPFSTKVDIPLAAGR
ncbi:MAG: type II secretion system protein GspJ [Syntrophotaleaceae bacterium]